MEHKFLGKHVVAELYGVRREDLDNYALIEEALREGIKKSGATLLTISGYKFDPEGLTIVGVLSESHTSVHTYPEQGALFFDAFTCGDTNPEEILNVLKNVLKPDRIERKIIIRGDSLLSKIKNSVRNILFNKKGDK